MSTPTTTTEQADRRTATIERTDALGSYNSATAGTLIGTNGMSVTWMFDAGRNQWEIEQMTPS